MLPTNPTAMPTPAPEAAQAPVALTILEAMADPALFARWFVSEESWRAWQAFLAALFGLSMSQDQAVIFRVHTGRQALPAAPAREAWLIVGRRGGKSRIAALVAVWLACFREYRPILAPGERGTIMLLAADRRQARTVFRYIGGLFDGVPMLAALVERRTRDPIYLTNRVVIEVHTASFRCVRGYTVVAAILDEVAYWRSEESANPDTEIINAIRPAMATVPGALLLALSSPYARRGELWRAYRQHYGQEGDPVLVWQADSRTMNPSVDAAVIQAAYEADEAAASAEYGAQFRRDIESFVSREAVEACVIPVRRELRPAAGIRYVAFVDPSGGSADAMTLAIAHHERGRAVLDLVRERRPPFSPAAVVREFAETLAAYGVSTVTGDRYGGEWCREPFREHGLWYHVAERAKSDLYRNLLPLLNSGTIDLLDHPRLVAQLCALERCTARGGRDTIDHTPGVQDDVANAVAGALGLALRQRALDEDDRPEDSFEQSTRELDDLKRAVLERGTPEGTVRRLEESVDPELLGVYLEDLLEEGTLRGRLRRAGLRIDDD
jgi:hypothetical protein